MAAAVAPAAPAMATSTLTPRVSCILDDGSSADGAGRKKTFAIPRSMPELKQAAGLHFDPKGRSSRMRMFHLGREMHHPLAVDQLKDGDVVIVRLERPLQRAAGAVLTTHQEDFVRHPLQSRGLRESEGCSAVASGMQGRLEGQSSYAADYVRHGAVERASGINSQVKYSKHWLSTPRGTERASTTYKQYFPWHAAQPCSGVENIAEGSVLTDASRGLPFSARTSYGDNYTKKEATLTRPSYRDSDSTLTTQARQGAFVGATEYAADYVKHPGDCRQPSARPDRGAYSYQPFSGNSEYRQQYVGKCSQA